MLNRAAFLDDAKNRFYGVSWAVVVSESLYSVLRSCGLQQSGWHRAL